MGWRSDWLYHLLFREIERVWNMTRREDQGRYGPAPARFFIEQYSDYTTNILLCSGTLLRVWSFDGSEFTLRSRDTRLTYDYTVGGMFYHDGIIQFHILTTRKQIIWNSWFGPLYARGMAFRVIGQGKSATLQKDSSFVQWVS